VKDFCCYVVVDVKFKQCGTMQGTAFSQWCCWRIKSSGMWHCVIRQAVCHVPKELCAFIFSCSEGEGAIIPWNIRNSLPKNSVTSQKTDLLMLYKDNVFLILSMFLYSHFQGLKLQNMGEIVFMTTSKWMVKFQVFQSLLWLAYPVWQTVSRI
jgi:hypothetical protein